jgi:hypothetical protein
VQVLLTTRQGCPFTDVATDRGWRVLTEPRSAKPELRGSQTPAKAADQPEGSTGLLVRTTVVRWKSVGSVSGPGSSQRIRAVPQPPDGNGPNRPLVRANTQMSARVRPAAPEIVSDPPFRPSRSTISNRSYHQVELQRSPRTGLRRQLAASRRDPIETRPPVELRNWSRVSSNP